VRGFRLGYGNRYRDRRGRLHPGRGEGEGGEAEGGRVLFTVVWGMQEERSGELKGDERSERKEDFFLNA